MKLSGSTGYGLLAMGYIAKHKDEGIIVCNDIAKEYNISLLFLFKILHQLVRVNILRSKRGPSGGFSLAKPANKISMLEIIEAIQGPLNSNLGLEDYDPNSKFSKKTEKANEKIVSHLRAEYAKVKLSDLL